MSGTEEVQRLELPIPPDKAAQIPFPIKLYQPYSKFMPVLDPKILDGLYYRINMATWLDNLWAKHGVVINSIKAKRQRNMHGAQR